MEFPGPCSYDDQPFPMELTGGNVYNLLLTLRQEVFGWL